MMAIGLGSDSASLRLVCDPTCCFHWIGPAVYEAGTMMSLWYGFPVRPSTLEIKSGLRESRRGSRPP